MARRRGRALRARWALWPAAAWCCALLLAGLGGRGTARASGFLVAEFGGEQGNPTTDDLTAMYFNPAGLSLSGGTRLYVNGLFAVRHLTYDRPDTAIDHVTPAGAISGTMTEGTPDNALGANSGKATLTNFAVLPFLGAASDFGVKGLGVGVSFYAPFGGNQAWDPNKAYAGSKPYPGAVDGVQRWSIIDGNIASYYLTFAGSYYIEKARLAVGMGVNIILNQVNLTRARNADGTDDLVTGAGTLQEGRSYLNVMAPTASLSFGLVWRPRDDVWVGASYQSQPGFGTNTLSGKLENKLGVAPQDSQPAELKQSLPDVVRAGVRWRPTPRVELRLSGEFVRWSVFHDQCILDATDPKRSCKFLPSGALDTASGGEGVILDIQRNWKDAFRVHAGVSYWAMKRLELYLGASFDSNAVPDATADAALIDMNKILADGGARLELLDGALAIAGTYTQFIFLDRTVDARPRGPTGTPVAPLPPSRNPDGAGTYTQSVGLFSLAVQYRFR